jgi:hypothetical protein
MKLSIKDTIGPRCIVKEDGQKIFNEICDPLKRGETITLDFNGVSQFATPFFNFAIGQLLNNMTEADVRSFLHFENLNETGKSVVERVIENAAKQHADKQYRDIVEEILTKQAKESD